MPLIPMIILGVIGTGGAVGLGYGVGRSTQQALTVASLMAGAWLVYQASK